MKRSYENREYFTPTPGEVYDNAGGASEPCGVTCGIPRGVDLIHLQTRPDQR